MHLNARIRRQPIDKRHDQPLGKLQINGEARPSPKRKHISIVLTVTPALISLAFLRR
jgi:hypothetical protein